MGEGAAAWSHGALVGPPAPHLEGDATPAAVAGREGDQLTAQLTAGHVQLPPCITVKPNVVL